MRILVMRRDNIGDLVCTTPLLAALRRRYPSGYLAALVNSYNAAVLDDNPNLDAVHVYTKLKHRRHGEKRLGILAQRLQLVVRLRAERFDYVILAKAAFDRHKLALARPLGAGNIVGFATERGDARGLSIALPPTQNGELHEVQAVMRLGTALDAREPPGALHVYPARERVAHWGDRMPALAAANRRIALHISAREPSRMWPAERFIALARALGMDGVKVVRVWAPGAADDARHRGTMNGRRSSRAARPFCGREPRALATSLPCCPSARRSSALTAAPCT